VVITIGNFIQKKNIQHRVFSIRTSHILVIQIYSIDCFYPKSAPVI